MGTGPQVLLNNSPKRRSFAHIRTDILRALSGGRTTVNDLSRITGINWKTVDNHLIYLCGRGWAEKVFDSTYVKIFDITEEGAHRLEQLTRRQLMAQGRKAKTPPLRPNQSAKAAISGSSSFTMRRKWPLNEKEVTKQA